KKIDSLIVIWPNDKVEIKKNVSVNQEIELTQSDATTFFNESKAKVRPLLTELNSPIFKHRENDHVDFNRERLIFSMLSTEGPAMAAGDINNDGLDDLFLGGAKGQSSSLIVQNKTESFARLLLIRFCLIQPRRILT